MIGPKGITGSAKYTLPEIAHYRCGRKKVYGDLGTAQEVAKRCKEERGDDLVAYRCIDCTGYHIAHRQSAEVSS
jgi:hypothetical protein